MHALTPVRIEIHVVLTLVYFQHINLGSGTEKLMDAIWVCEQSARELEYEKNEIPWKIYYRKEVYNPLEEYVVVISWTDFAYNYVVNGIRSRVTKLRRVRLLKYTFNNAKLSLV